MMLAVTISILDSGFYILEGLPLPAPSHLSALFNIEFAIRGYPKPPFLDIAIPNKDYKLYAKWDHMFQFAVKGLGEG
jgi:hypothetical protein